MEENSRLIDVNTYRRYKVYESHNSEGFKRVCSEFKKDLERYWMKRSDVDMEF